MIYKAKVVDEPDEYVIGILIENNKIFQLNPHDKSKFCSIGIFNVIPETIEIIEN